MNIKKDKINFHELNIKGISYIFSLFIIISIGIILLMIFKTSIYYEYKGILEDNLIKIDNLDETDLDVILNSQKIIINKKKINYEVISIKEENSLYLLILKIDTKGISVTSNLTLTSVLKEECLYEFIFKTIKGGIFNG